MPLMLAIAASCGLLFGALLTFLSVGKALLALAALTAATTVMRWPVFGFLLFGLMAALLPYTTVNLGIRITISEALLALTWIAVGWRLFIGEKTLELGATEKAVMRLLVFSLIPFAVGQVVISAEGSGLVNWIRWLLNVSTLFLVPILLDTQKKRGAMVVALLLGNLVMLIVSITIFLQTRDALAIMPLLEKLQYSHPEALLDIFSANYTRMGSPWVHPNLTGGALALFIPLALFYGMSNAGWRKLLAYAVALLGAAGLLFSISRGAIVSLAVVMIWFVYLRVPYVTKVLVIGSVLTASLVLFYPPLQERLSTMFSSQNASTQVRADEYRAFPKAVARYPLGIGFKVDPPVPDSDLLGISNLWLNYMYKIGVIGMILFIAATVSWWREVRPAGKMREITQNNALWLGTVGALLSALGTGIFDHYYSFTMVLVGLFWMLVGMSLQQAREMQGNAKAPGSPPA
jgi:hypothetical protein